MAEIERQGAEREEDEKPLKPPPSPKQVLNTIILLCVGILLLCLGTYLVG